MKKKLGLFLILAFLVSGMGLVLSGCGNNGKVFSKEWATKSLNKVLAQEDVVIGKGLFDSYFTHYVSKKAMSRYPNYLAKLVAIDDPIIRAKFLNKPAGYFTGHVDICKPKFGTRFGRKIYGCSYTFIFHPSKDYKKLINIETYNGKLKMPENRPPYIYSTYTTKRAGIAFAKDKKSGVWKVVGFNFNPYGSPIYK